MIFPVVIIPWPPVRFILIVMAVIFVIFGALYITQASFKPVPKETGSPALGVMARR